MKSFHQPATSPRASRQSSDVAIEDRRVGIDATVAEEWPVAACFLDQLSIAFRDEHFRLCPAFDKNSPEWIGNERVAKEFDAVGTGLVFMSNPVGRSDEH